MTKRLNWEKLRYLSKPKVSVTDEAEHFDDDRAARWLARAEQNLSHWQRWRQNRPETDSGRHPDQVLRRKKQAG